MAEHKKVVMGCTTYVIWHSPLAYGA